MPTLITRRAPPALVAALFLGIGSPIATVSTVATAAPVAAPAPMAQPTTPPAGTSSGIDRSTFDPQSRPQDDFFRWVNGGWLDRTEIPPDRSRWGAFDMLREQARRQLREIVDEVALANNVKPNSPQQQIRDLYRSFMNDERVAAQQTKALAPLLARAQGINSRDDLLSWLAWANTVNVPVPIGAYVDQDGGDTTRYLVHFTQWGLGMPDRDYYLKQDDDRLRAARQAYAVYQNRLFELAGLPPQAAAVMRIEQALATAQWSQVRNRDRKLTYNLYSIKDAPALPWARLVNDMGTKGVREIVIRQPDYPQVVAQLLAESPIEDWRAYATFHLLNTIAPYLGPSFVDAHFQFNGRVLSGTEENQARWKRAISLLNGGVGELLGQLYVARHFPPGNKQRMDGLVTNLQEAFRVAINQLDWMTAPTKAEAQAKLAAFGTKIGYPDVWRDYSSLRVDPADLVGNVMRIQAFDHQRAVAKLGGPIDRTEWFMTPQTVNAYYSPKMNEIVFPAAILQPPFFDVTADDAVNYGAIGAVIGHEISHGFDDQGRRSDGAGNLRDWWTPTDATEFRKRTSALIAQYAAFEPLPGTPINGELTLGENIGDLSGLAVAYRAWQMSLQGKQPRVIDGRSGTERFFIGWAQAWRTKQRDAALQRQLLTDPHSPAPYRANGAIRNLDAFHTTFGTQPSDGMYLRPDQRVKIW